MSNVLSFLLFLSFGSVVKPCENRVVAESYSVCFPKGWSFEYHSPQERIFACSQRGACTSDGGGFPLGGVITLALYPLERVYPKMKISSVLDVVAGRDVEFSRGVYPVTLLDGSAHEGRECVVSESLMPTAKNRGLWYLMYGLKIQGRYFRAVVQFNNEPSRNKRYREVVAMILSSLQITEEPN